MVYTCVEHILSNYFRKDLVNSILDYIITPKYEQKKYKEIVNYDIINFEKFSILKLLIENTKFSILKDDIIDYNLSEEIILKDVTHCKIYKNLNCGCFNVNVTQIILVLTNVADKYNVRLSDINKLLQRHNVYCDCYVGHTDMLNKFDKQYHIYLHNNYNDSNVLLYRNLREAW